MKDFLSKAGAMIASLLLVMAMVFTVVTGFQYSALFGVAGLVLSLAAAPTLISLVRYLMGK